MLNPRHRSTSGQASAGNSVSRIGAMAFAKTVAAEFQTLETGYRNGLYAFFGRALTSYRKFLTDPQGYAELLDEENISSIREKPEVESTSRLVLYYHTGARDDAERNTAGKYARVVDYLHQKRIRDTEAAEYVRSEGGMDAILQKARGHEVPEVAKDAKDNSGEALQGEEGGEALQGEEAGEALQDAESDSDDREDGNEPPTRRSESGNEKDEIFDPDRDLSIRVGGEACAQVLASDIAMNELFYLECKKIAFVGRYTRIVGRLVKSPSE